MLKKAVVIMLLVALVLVFISCDGKSKYAGNYRAYGQPDDILQLKKDGGFLKRESDTGTTTGTWEVVSGDEIILSSKPGEHWDGKYNLRVMDGKLVSRLGTEWKKN